MACTPLQARLLTRLVLPATLMLPSGVAGGKAQAEGPAKAAIDKSLPVRVLHPKKIGVWELPAERVRLGEEDEVSPYKPSLALLPGGELVLIAFHSKNLPGNKIDEWTSLWRSADSGLSWTAQGTLKD